MSKIRSVLFVCTGNTCRSVMAEGLLKKYLKDNGRDDVTVQSAGLSALGGQAPTMETVMVAKADGVDVSGHKSQYLTGELIRSADLILTMEEYHKNRIAQWVPEASGKTFLLKEFGTASAAKNLSRLDIADPIGMPLEAYRESEKEIKAEIERIGKYI